MEPENTMATPDAQDPINSTTRTCQIMTASLVVGVVVMLGFSIWLDPIASERAAPRPGPGNDFVKGAGADAIGRPVTDSPDVGQILTWIAVPFALLLAAISFVVPGLITSGGRRKIAARRTPSDPDALEADTRELALLYQTKHIAAAAICEGPAFFAAIVYMLGKDPIAIGAAVLLLGLLIMRFPTHRRVAAWIDRQQEALIHERRAAI